MVVSKRRFQRLSTPCCLSLTLSANSLCISPVLWETLHYQVFLLSHQLWAWGMGQIYLLHWVFWSPSRISVFHPLELVRWDYSTRWKKVLWFPFSALSQSPASWWVLISLDLCKHVDVLVYCLLGKCDVGQGLFYLVFSGIVGEGCSPAVVPSVLHSNVANPRNSHPAEQVSTAPPLHPPPEPPSQAAHLQHLLPSLAGKLGSLFMPLFQHVNVEDLQRLMSRWNFNLIRHGTNFPFYLVWTLPFC